VEEREEDVVVEEVEEGEGDVLKENLEDQGIKKLVRVKEKKWRSQKGDERESMFHRSKHLDWRQFSW